MAICLLMDEESQEKSFRLGFVSSNKFEFKFIRANNKFEFKEMFRIYQI